MKCLISKNRLRPNVAIPSLPSSFGNVPGQLVGDVARTFSGADSYMDQDLKTALGKQ